MAKNMAQFVEVMQLVTLGLEDPNMRIAAGAFSGIAAVVLGSIYDEINRTHFGDAGPTKGKELWILGKVLEVLGKTLQGGEPPDIKGRVNVELVEVLTYLHARAQRDVLHLLESRLSQKDPIIYSTHSPFLIPADRLHRLRIVLKTADTGTIVVDRLTHPRLCGTEFADTMSPILTAIGLDIRQSLTFARNRNLIVEGISDYYYISGWSRLTGIGLMEALHVFPADGAMSEVTLASLFIGWGLDFAALLDREPIGNAARDKLIRELGVADSKVNKRSGLRICFHWLTFSNS